ncbi:MAG: ABC transporter permease [Armatimonadota bacterium]|nr:ABC transporter permease [Armatimonadota bacterium]MDR7464842.1 ABC transporter permease [Armatimonadota bacterium]MDR7469587.1 ABC transporter permease [Armatimonadota bacterium]MDR7475840.1 ABC transporter permease [Armatimonadota bacterium]MDR7538307.1 ABC transporter permease [Armatimonadota bacterium]
METAVTFARLVMLTLVPYVLAGQGTMLAGRAGVFNVAQEGIMLVGASVGFLGAYLSGGNLLQGMLLAMAVGGLFGLALAYFTTTLKMDQFVTGLALFFIGMALSTLLYRLAIGVTLTPPLIPTLRELPLPGLSRIPLLGVVLFRQNALVYGAVLLSLALYLFLYSSGSGMALRAVGENPMAADSLGVNVNLTRYLTTVTGAMLMGLAGAYLPMVYTATFTEGMVRGRGWLSIALTFFGGWSPHLIFLGALFFAAVEVLAFRVQVTGVGIPYQLILMLPYLATMAVMMPTFRRLQVPAFLGKNYDRERRALL